MRHCVECFAPIENGQRGKARYCSVACKQRQYRKRKKQEKKAQEQMFTMEEFQIWQRIQNRIADPRVMEQFGLTFASVKRDMWLVYISGVDQLTHLLSQKQQEAILVTSGG